MLRRLPTAELLRRLPTISDDFRFPNHCSPTEPIRGLPNNTPHLHDSRDQTNPQCCSTLYLGIYLFWKKRYPFRISSIDKWYPFHIPSSEFGIPFNCFKCTVLKILINHVTKTFSGLYLSHEIHLLALLSLFIRPNDRFPYPLIHFSYPFNTWSLKKVSLFGRSIAV